MAPAITVDGGLNGEAEGDANGDEITSIWVGARFNAKDLYEDSFKYASKPTRTPRHAD